MIFLILSHSSHSIIIKINSFSKKMSMKLVTILLIVIIFSVVLLSYQSVRQLSRYLAKRCESAYELKEIRVPDDFIFGASTSAYQIEGAWNVDGKGISIWDHILHTRPEVVRDGSNGDIAADSYHLYKKDIEALKRIGFNFYRFSISWTRILPNGGTNEVNLAGIEYYHRVIDECILNGIEPIVTTYHLDLPQSLQDLGGWSNPIMAQYYEGYVDILFQHFGSKVKRWITFNEPFDACVDGYGRGTLPPFVLGAEYLCAHHILISHATAYHLYKNKYKHLNGKIGITLNSRYFIPKNGKNSSLTERGMQYMFGWFGHPLLSAHGDYPSIMRQEIAVNSKNENQTASRLPFMNTQLKLFIRGTVDYLSFNYYTSNIVEYNLNFTSMSPSWDKDSRLILGSDPTWKQSKTKWIYNVPQGIYKTLKWIYEQYDNPEILITENGWSDDGQIEDIDRIDYIKQHLREVLKMKLCGNANIVGYGVWSLLDNFEWLSGYTEHFGLYAIKNNSSEKERIPKMSTKFIQNIIMTRNVPY
uniref:CSON012226 protein n=1 Tax=Culicoides sonorensis TaxID=179676 RepID=A0A336M500_CULSO